MAELPGGTVTLLFTDIEGSTRLVEQLEDRYPAVLADHHRVLGVAVEAHGGRAVSTQGGGRGSRCRPATRPTMGASRRSGGSAALESRSEPRRGEGVMSPRVA